MKRMKCYGKTQTNTVDSSFKRNFFGSLDCMNVKPSYRFQDNQEKAWALANTGSTSIESDIHSFGLFASDPDLDPGPHFRTYGDSLEIGSRKRKCSKLSDAHKPERISGPSISHSFIDLLPILTSRKAKKPIKKNTTYKVPYKRYNSKTRKTSRLHSLNKHSSIPILPSCSYFFENPSSVIKTGIKKTNKKCCIKKKRQIKKDNDVATSDCPNMDTTPIQPNWSSILKHSFTTNEIAAEKPKERKKEKFCVSEEHGINGYSNTSSFAPKNSSKEKMVLSNDESISGENDGKKKSMVEQKHLESKGIIVSSKPKTAENILQNDSANKKVLASFGTDMVFGRINSEMTSADNLCTNDKESSNLCEVFSESLNFNEVTTVNNEKNASKDKSVGIYTEKVKSENSNEDILGSMQKKITGNKANCEDKNIFKTNPNCSFEYLNPIISYSTNNGCLYSSTPLTSPSIPAFKGKDFASDRAFSPFLQKGKFTTSTPTQSPRLVKALVNSSLKQLKSPSIKISSSLLSKGNQSHLSVENISYSFRIRSEQSSLAESHSNLELRSSKASIIAESNIKSSLPRLLDFCGQTSIIPFSELYDWSLVIVRKIGEGAYGEVFTLVQNRISSVIKVVPFSEDNGNRSMQNVETVLSEVTVSKCLSELRNNEIYQTRNFNKLKSVRLVKGDYPNQMLVAWDKYSESKSTYNSRPDIFNDQQMFAVIELEYGGKDMADFVLRNAAEAEIVLKQIAISLAIAEEAHLFEHRDLHLGNILVQRNASKNISYVLGGKSFSIPNQGLVVTIIDFTFSRVLQEGCVFYNDIQYNESLFDQSGDYQFEIYKKTKLLLNNEWQKCLLYSNVLWLTYLCVKLLECNYSRPSSKKHEESLKNIANYKEILETCENAYECLSKCCICILPKKAQVSSKKMSLRVRYVDRKSLQKSISQQSRYV